MGVSCIRTRYNSLSLHTQTTNMAIRRYTESQNVRFEVHVVELLEEALKSDWCIQQRFNRSDLIRHLVRVGLVNFQKNSSSKELFEMPLDREIMG
jgi:hypothetical protein